MPFPFKGLPCRFAPALLVGLCILFSSSIHAAAVAMDEFGVCAKPHGAPDPNAYCDQLIASGVKWVRIAPEWGGLETSKGVPNNIALANLDNVVDRLRAGGVNILWILCFTAPWASSQPSQPSPQITRYKPANWADWEDYVSFITLHYRGRISHWEVWNEPDHRGFWKDSVADYYTLLQKAYVKVKATDSTNTVLLGGQACFTGTIESYGIGSFFDQLMALGAGSYFDVVNYHVYGAYARHLSRHQGMLDVINKYGIQSKPIWITETGYSTVGSASLEAAKADMVDQIHIGNRAWSDVTRYFWYCYDDPVIVPPNPTEENYGLTASYLKDITPPMTPLKAHRSYIALDGASTDFALQAAYPALAPVLHTLYYYPATSGDGGYVTAAGNDRLIPATRYMYFRVNDDWLYDGNGGLDNSVYIDVTFLDTGIGNFALQYDSTVGAYQTVSRPRTNSGLWKTATFSLTDAKFANRQNNASDFRLYAGGVGLTVRNITLHKSFSPAAVILKTTPTSKLIDFVVDPSLSSEAYSQVATMGGIECRSTSDNQKYMYFRVSDAFIRPGDTHVTIYVKFWDAGRDRLILQYRATDGSIRGKSIYKGGNNAWRTEPLEITDACFDNSVNFGGDFRIGNGWDDTTEYISRIDVAPHNQAWVALGESPTYKNLQYVIAPSGEAENAATTIGGVGCRTIAAGTDANSKYLYFRANDDLFNAGTPNLAISITFWDSGTDALALQYSAIGTLYKGVPIYKTNTNTWRTVTVPLTDANFVNTQNNAADFRIGNGEDDTIEYVSRVELTAADNTPDYDNWAKSNPWGAADSSPQADPNVDGINNLLAYALNLNPIASGAPALLPSVSLDTRASDGPWLIFDYRENKYAADLVYTVETSTDLVNWSAAVPDGVTIVSEVADANPDGDSRSLVRRMRIHYIAGVNNFLRLAIRR